ncbi:molybdenum cofactor guanylyltransferase [Haloferacaceae archaeon DSL9]
MTTALKPDTGRAGIVLAGGRSNRFVGGDKALASLDGKPLVQHAVDTLEVAADEVIVNCRRRQRTRIADALETEVRFAVDPIPDRGPLVGLRAALDETDAAYAAVLGCDMPFVPAAFVDALFERARHRTGAVARFDGRIHPLPAVVHVRAGRAACDDAVRNTNRRLGDLVDRLDPSVAPEREVRARVSADAFRNINTAEQLHDAIGRR